MRKDVADMWVAGLRSGEYQQATEMLRDGDGFCCLGVLCDLHKRRTNEGDWSGSAYCILNTEDDGSETILPAGVVRWAECQSDPTDRETGEFFTRLNDEYDYSFAQLADMIESQWEEL
jgi:hypothetical protein